MGDQGFTTRAIHTASCALPTAGNPVSFPIFQTTSFEFESMDELEALNEHRMAGFAYSRLGNPTVAAFEQTMAALEGAEAAVAFASGVGAIYSTMLSILSAGDHVIVTRDIYGGTYSLITKVLPRMGISHTFVDMTDHAAIEAAFTPQTKFVWGETVSNPTTVVLDIPTIAAIAHSHGVLLGIDATFTTPYLSQPIAQGADLSVHSATKYIGGHGDVIAGVVAGRKELIEQIHFMMWNVGSNLAPLEAFLLLRGLKTLEIRMDRHSANAMSLAESLQQHPFVTNVYYPGLAHHPQHDLAKRLLRNFGGFLSFTVTGDIHTARAVIDNVHLAHRAASLGDTDTLISLPIMTSHRVLSPEFRAEIGVTDTMIRVPVGIENIGDIIADFQQALNAAQATLR